MSATKETGQARRQGARLWLFALSLILVGACVFPGDDSGRSPPPCDCPNLVRIVESIGWVPGVEGRQRGASASDDQSRRGVTYHFEVDDAMTEVQRLQSIFEDHNLPVEEDRAVQGFRLNGNGYGILISILEGHLRLNIALSNGTPDEQADEVLRSVIEAVGLRG